MVKEHNIAITRQVQDGCVTASARSLMETLGISFDDELLPRLQRYTLDPHNPENNHMLGDAIVGADYGLETIIHRAVAFEGDVVAVNAAKTAKDLYPLIAKQIVELTKQRKIVVKISNLNQDQMMEFIMKNINKNRLGLAILDWDKWNPKVQKVFGNPRHVVVIYGVEGDEVLVMDPSLPYEENPVRSDPKFLLNALNEKQTIIFFGKQKKYPINKKL